MFCSEGTAAGSSILFEEVWGAVVTILVMVGIMTGRSAGTAKEVRLSLHAKGC
jgi:hypothetical protein